MRGTRFGLWLAAGVSAYAAVVYAALRPLHEREFVQPVLATLQAVDFLLQIPGLAAAQLFGLRAGHHTTTLVWSFALCVNAFVYFAAGCWITAPRRRDAPPQQTPTPAPADSPPARAHSRRKFLKRALGVGAGAALGYGLFVEPRWFRVTRRQIALRDLPAPLDGLRVVHLTDVHHGPWLSLRYVREVVEAANDLRPDLVCLTGDYVHHSGAYVAPVAEELARLRPRIASVAVLGNHDWWEDAALMRRELARAGIPLLDNARRVLTPDGRLVAAADSGLAVCGVGDFWEDRPDYAAALDGLPRSMPRLLLSHNPDAAEAPGLLEGGWRVDLMLSGHTHGGQIVLPGLGPPVTNSRHGTKYARGLVQGPACAVYVSCGIGVSGFPVRFGAPPEIAVLELRAASA